MEDSTKATMKHKEWVKDLMGALIDDMVVRSMHHDDSKLEDPEKSLFDNYSSKLKDCTYGSDEYKNFLKNSFAIFEKLFSPSLTDTPPLVFSQSRG